MIWINLFRFLHVMSAILFIGALFSRQVVRAYAKDKTDVRILAELLNAAGRIESVLLIPFNMMVLVFGIIYAVLIKAPTFGFLQGSAHNWLLVTNILMVLSPLPVIFFFLPRGKKFEPIMQAALAKGQITPELAEQLNDPAMKRVHLLEMIGVVFVVMLMVFRPF